jgi:hypothetical protein
VTATKIYTEPHFITRKDREVGRWSAEECAPRRGEARTDIVNRNIYAPVGDTPLEKVIRAHELMHTKITPAESFKDWIKRGVASEKALRAVEELRVNYGIEYAGFNLDDLTDGNEDADGEYVAIHRNWESAVMFAVATAGTAGGKRFLTGVRRHNKLWADALQKIQKRMYKEIIGSHTGKSGRKHVPREKIFSTEIHPNIGLYPEGFGWTERWAEFVDRVAKEEPREPQKIEAKKVSAAKDEDEGEEEEKGDEKTTTNVVGVGSTVKENTPEESFDEILRSMNPLRANRGSEQWSELVWGKVPLSTVSKGTLGRKRVAMNVGKNPRRIHRLYQDPQRRVFDVVRKAQGGVVLIDGSGSMCLSRKQVLDILKIAPGAVIAIYSDMDEGKGDIPNIHVIAKDGKCVEERNMPRFGAGNGVDGPALDWAIKQRENSKTPVVWITDGGVCAPKGGFSDRLAMSCINTAKKNNVIVVQDTEDATQVLKSLVAGRNVRWKWPTYFAGVLQKVGGRALTRQEVSA